jgi:hypothetical protein
MPTMRSDRREGLRLLSVGAADGAASFASPVPNEAEACDDAVRSGRFVALRNDWTVRQEGRVDARARSATAASRQSWPVTINVPDVSSALPNRMNPFPSLSRGACAGTRLQRCL